MKIFQNSSVRKTFINLYFKYENKKNKNKTRSIFYYMNFNSTLFVPITSNKKHSTTLTYMKLTREKRNVFKLSNQQRFK